MSSLRSSEVATAAGVNVQTLRYYERRGLLREPDRSPGGHRMYPKNAVTTLRVIKAAQRLGFTLEEVAELVEVAGHHHGRRPGADLQSRLVQKIAEVETKIADLRIIHDTLQAAVRAGCEDLAECAHRPDCPLPFSDLANADPSAGA